MTKTRQEVADLVRGYFSRNQFDGTGLTVLPDEVRRDGSEWRVPVHPVVEPVKRYPFYEYLAEIEGDIEDNEREFVFLVPADPLDETAA